MIGEGVRVEVEHTNTKTNKDGNTNTDTTYTMSPQTGWEERWPNDFEKEEEEERS